MIRVLLGRELLRLRKNPTPLLLLGLTITIALLTAASVPRKMADTSQTGRPICWIVYEQKSPWIEHLYERLSEDPSFRFARAVDLSRSGQTIRYPPGVCAIEIRTETKNGSEVGPLQIRYRHFGADDSVLWPFARRFWVATTEHYGNLPNIVDEIVPIASPRHAAQSTLLATAKLSQVVTIELVGTILLFFVQFLCCCHLFVSFTSQDRERGTLSALALTPINVGELLAAKFILHLGLSLGTCAAVIAFLKPSALGTPGLWWTLFAASCGFLAIGTLIAALSRTQATAALLTLCYMLVSGVIFSLADKFSLFASLKQMMFENHSLNLTYVSLCLPAGFFPAPGLLLLSLLVLGWGYAGGHLFRRLAFR
jgi:hypothetical protein